MVRQTVAHGESSRAARIRDLKPERQNWGPVQQLELNADRVASGSGQEHKLTREEKKQAQKEEKKAQKAAKAADRGAAK